MPQRAASPARRPRCGCAANKRAPVGPARGSPRAGGHPVRLVPRAQRRVAVTALRGVGGARDGRPRRHDARAGVRAERAGGAGVAAACAALIPS